MNFALIDTLGTLIVLSTTVAAIAIVFAAYMLVRPGWQFAARNGVILLALIVDLLVSLRVFEPSILRTMGPLVEPGTELLYFFVVPVLVLTIALFASPYMRAVNDDMPISWTIWPQTFRAIGGIFLVYWAAGHMPGGFALPAGIGDLLVGLTAPWMTIYVLRGVYSKRAALSQLLDERRPSFRGGDRNDASADNMGNDGRTPDALCPRRTIGRIPREVGPHGSFGLAGSEVCRPL